MKAAWPRHDQRNDHAAPLGCALLFAALFAEPVDVVVDLAHGLSLWVIASGVLCSLTGALVLLARSSVHLTPSESVAAPARLTTTDASGSRRPPQPPPQDWPEEEETRSWLD
jgi:hypothetical protein